MADFKHFVYLRSQAIAFVKEFTQVATSICSGNINAPEDPVIRAFVDAKLLGSHHVPVSGPPGPDLKVILCTNIAAKCIKVETSEAHIFAYLTPVTDIGCT